MEQLYLPKNHYFCTKLKKISSQWNNFQKLFLSLYRHLEKEVATSRRAISFDPSENLDNSTYAGEKS
jgi:hypothetical protein